MEKKLPGVFANKIDKEFYNNDRVYYSSSNSNYSERSENKELMEEKNQTKMTLNINQKINNIFNSNRYVYKAEVVITTKDEKLVKKIIGQNKTHLITMENELIPISDIIDISFSN